MMAHERALRLGAQGKVHEAKAALDAAIASGDGDAAFVLANWRIEGLLIRRDLGEARSLSRWLHSGAAPPRRNH